MIGPTHIPAPTVRDALERLRIALAGRYDVERLLGAGGMATVYLARDLRHERSVAVKVLRPEVAAALGPERFLREIRIAARLLHPHILPVHDSGEADGFLFYVMPYIEGQSLRERLQREHELPVAEAARILRDVADGLALAHTHGIVHRDIKPENVLLSGRHALVSDFGVARAIDSSAEEQLTGTGIALGTPAYMAPEQAAAAPQIDHRADIYALGVMAYEMLTGQLPFGSRTPQTMLAAHLSETPRPIVELRPAVPSALADLIMQCLEKRAADRPQRAEDLVPVLEAVTTPSGGTAAAARGRTRRVWIAPVGAAALIGIGLTAFAVLRPETSAIMPSAIRPVTSEPGIEWQPAISPDGKEVAYVAGPIDGQELVIRSAVNATAGGETRLADPAWSTWLPRWSPDGEFVRFLACPRASSPWSGVCAWKERGRLGGPVRPVTVPRNSWTAAWSPDGATIAYSIHDSIFSAPSSGGDARLLAVHRERPGFFLHSLAWSPDGRRLAYVSGNMYWLASGYVAESSIWVVDAQGGAPAHVTGEEFLNLSPVWLDNSHLLFVSNRGGPRGVYVVGVGRRGSRGEPRSVLDASDVHSITYSANAKRLAYVKLTLHQNIWSYPTAKPAPIPIGDGRHVTTGNQVVVSHDLSPDGRWLTYNSNLGGNANIYKLNLDGGAPVQITSAPGDEGGPVWSPDGTEIAFYDELGQIFVIPAEGGVATPLTKGTGSGVAPQWSPDGRHIAFMPSGNGPRELRFLGRDRVGGPWRETNRLPDAKCQLLGWAADGRGVLCTDNVSTLMVLSQTGRVLWSRDVLATDGLRVQGLSGRYASDGATVYVCATRRDGRRGVWGIPARGGPARLVLSTTDPALSFFAYLSLRPGTLYATVSDYESDVWTMRLQR